MIHTRNILLFLLLFASVEVFAQKIRIAVVNTDSILNLLPEYKNLITVMTDYQIQAQNRAMAIQMDYTKKQQKLDSAKALHADARLLMELKVELDTIQSQYDAFIKLATDSALELQTMKFTPIQQKWHRAVLVACEKNRCNGYIEFDILKGARLDKKFSYVDINKDVLGEMKSPSKSVGKKRVGICNYDSLLKMVQGYKVVNDSLNSYDTLSARAIRRMKSQLDTKKKELDSLGPASSERILRIRNQEIAALEDNILAFEELAEFERDKIETDLMAPLVYSLDLRIAQVCSENRCPVTFDQKDAVKHLNSQEVEFIDLNKAIAEKLKQ